MSRAKHSKKAREGMALASSSAFVYIPLLLASGICLSTVASVSSSKVSLPTNGSTHKHVHAQHLLMTTYLFSHFALYLLLAQMEVDGKFDHGNQQPPSLFSWILTKGIKFILDTRPCLSSLSSHPLFSFSVASQVLILLYLPRLFIRLFFSPVLFYTLIFLVLTFLILSLSVGLALPADKHDETNLENKSETSAGSYSPTCDHSKAKTDAVAPLEAEAEGSRRPLLTSAANCSRMDWSPKWPLEVIYEDYEAEVEKEDEEGVGSAGYYYSLVGRQQSNDRLVEVQGLEEWGLCLPDSDSGSSCSSEREYPAELPTWESVGSLDMFRWEEEEEEEEETGKDGMIEISLGGKGFPAGEEESLIEIDLYGASR